MKINVQLTRQENAEYFGVEVGAVHAVDFESYAAAASATQAASLATQAAQEATEAADHSVQYNSTQTLTTAQKATARSNIGLSAVDDGNGNITFS